MYVLNADIIACMLLRLEALMYEISVVTKENEVWLDKIIAWEDSMIKSELHKWCNKERIGYLDGKG